jgi:hypothetical protein
MQAIEKLLSGERRWNPKKEPDLFKLLTSVADSIISHLAQAWENRRVRSESALSAHAGADGEEANQIASYADPIDCPSALAVQHEQEKESNAFLSQLRDFLRKEPELQKAVDCILDGTVKRADIAAGLGLSVKETTNLRKKLQVRLKHFLAERNKKPPFSKGEHSDA